MWWSTTGALSLGIASDLVGQVLRPHARHQRHKRWTLSLRSSSVAGRVTQPAIR
jgi:hypothetical protein